MDYKEFSQSIKAKYPQYADMADEDLAHAMVNKYPQYSDVTFGKIQPTQESGLDRAAGVVNKIEEGIKGGLTQGIPQSIQDAVSQGSQAVLKPIGEAFQAGNKMPGELGAASRFVSALPNAPQIASEKLVAALGKRGIAPNLSIAGVNTGIPFPHPANQGEESVNSPYVNAAVALPLNQVYNLLGAMQTPVKGIANVVSDIGEGADATGQALKNLASKAGNRIIQGKSTEELANFPIKQAEMERLATLKSRDIGSAIENARNNVELPQDFNPVPVHGTTPAEVAQSMNEISKTPVRELASQSTKDLLAQRDAADAALRGMKFSNDEYAIVTKGKSSLDSALMEKPDFNVQEIGARYKQYGVHKQASSEEMGKLLSSKPALRASAAKEKMIRKLGGFVIGGGGVGGALTYALRRLGGQ